MKSEELKNRITLQILETLTNEKGVDFVEIGPNKGDDLEFFYSSNKKLPSLHYGKFLEQPWVQRLETK